MVQSGATPLTLIDQIRCKVGRDQVLARGGRARGGRARGVRAREVGPEDCRRSSRAESSLQHETKGSLEAFSDVFRFFWGFLLIFFFGKGVTQGRRIPVSARGSSRTE